MPASAVRSGYERALSLCRESAQDLDQLFRASAPGELPAGPITGAMIVRPGTGLAEPTAHLMRALVWQGKVVDAGRNQLVNIASPFRIQAVRAEVYPGPSWFDGRPCIVLDYARKSWVAPMVRDELREIEPGLWLGLAYVWRVRLLRFALATDASADDRTLAGRPRSAEPASGR